MPSRRLYRKAARALLDSVPASYRSVARNSLSKSWLTWP
ncbi:hypothetical protein PSYJA_38044, partial [Pseudomonas syringae pv. japonica str. M301072]